jgi:phosphotransferase system enzyme I (PtsI)
MKEFYGIPASPGMITGRAFLYQGTTPEIPRYSISNEQVESEWCRLETALFDSVADVQCLYEQALHEMSHDQADILQAHIMILEDVEFKKQIRDRLLYKLQNIEWIVWDVAHEFTQKLMASPDAYLRERATDIADVSGRVINRLLCIARVSLSYLPSEVIIVAHDLMPSEVLAMDRSMVKGIVMDMGGRTSHTAILTRAFGIPSVLGLSDITKEINDNDMLMLDGTSGRVVVDPDAAIQTFYEGAIDQYQKQQGAFERIRELPAQTTDGHRVRLNANIETPEEAEQLKRYGAEGIGLYRSEFLFLAAGHRESEEQQFQTYCRVIKVMGALPVTIRTLDIGGDKMLPGMQEVAEKNPLLGWRAIRFCIARPDFFKIQLRALLRASVFGTMRILFPMISGIEELEQICALLEEAKGECRRRGQAYNEHIEVGSMIEVPSAALTADILAERSDFFSIGTNDLVQYTMAIDRGNEKVNYLGQPFHPAVLRLIKGTIDAAHNRGITAAMCGELAGDPSATRLLLGLGLDELSMVAQSIPQIKQIIRSASWAQCQVLAREALSCTSIKQVSDLVNS